MSILHVKLAVMPQSCFIPDSRLATDESARMVDNLYLRLETRLQDCLRHTRSSRFLGRLLLFAARLRCGFFLRSSLLEALLQD
jgi:hypothetical protein